MPSATTIIGIAGPSGSGKSTICQRLLASMGGQAMLIAEDAYYRDQSDLSFENRTQVNYDHPDALEHSLLAEHLQALKQGQPVISPVYDFTAHTRSADTTVLNAAPIIIVEGILLLADTQLREQLDIKVYLDTDTNTCLDRRVARDIVERGRDEEDVRRQYRETVEPMLHEYVIPSRLHADLIIPTDRYNTLAESMLVSYLEKLSQ